MEFMNSRPDVVRSASQVWLLKTWNRLRGVRRLPLVQDLELDELAAVSETLSFNDVVAVNGSARFRVRFHGKRVGEAYGSADCHGKFLDEILPAAYLNAALSTYDQVIAARLPVYTVADMRDQAGRIVHYERLLLPFSQQGLEVEGILASLETVSPEGDFEHRELMKSPPKAPAFALCTTISAYGLPAQGTF
jgi:hypothetical protein